MNMNQIGLSYASDFDCLFQPSSLDANLWEIIIDLKAQFLRNEINIYQSPYICPEIADSWLRSRSNKIDPFMKKLGDNSHIKDYEELVKNKKILIQTVSSYIRKFMPLLTASEYIMCLTDENGVVLLIEGSPKEIDSFNRLDIGLATNLSEELVGTTAHSLCIRHRKPVQIIGPYNFLTALQDNITSATPIMDENNNVLGTIIVVQMVTKRDLHNLNAHSLGWVISMGFAIENLLKVRKRNSSLSLMNGILHTTLSLVDEGIITLNKEGMISHINAEGAAILGVPAEEVNNKHFSVFMKPDQCRLISDALFGGSSIQDYETVINNNHSGIQCLMNIRPVLEEKIPNGAVMRLVRSEKVDRLVVQRGGAIASYRFNDIIGASPAVQKAIRIGRDIGRKQINVLLIGESGTGKELFAQSIHNESRSSGPFVAINCASIPRNLFESELFGYEGGAFTGAERKGRPGKIELANNGTLFLDEIGDMPLEIQPVFLRILEDKRVMRLGGNRYIPVDFRIVAATNKDLYQMVQEKSFREDLYFRLSVFKIIIPPLRDRGDDILLLAAYFMEDICKKLKCHVPKWSPGVKKIISEYYWPGNVRQLQNAIVYAVNMAHDGIIEKDDLPDELLYGKPHNINKSKSQILTLEEVEKNTILEALELTNNNTIEAAMLLGVGRSTIYRKLKQYGIDYLSF